MALPPDSSNFRRDTVSPTSPDSAMHDPADPPPMRPAEPDADDCCAEGCIRCIYDIYEEKLERYQEAMQRWRGRQP